VGISSHLLACHYEPDGTHRPTCRRERLPETETTGNINHGLGLEPVGALLPGNAHYPRCALVSFRTCAPPANGVIAGDSRPVRYVLLCLSAFLVFDWRSIFRVILLHFSRQAGSWNLSGSGLRTRHRPLLVELPRVTYEGSGVERGDRGD